MLSGLSHILLSTQCKRGECNVVVPVCKHACYIHRSVQRADKSIRGKYVTRRRDATRVIHDILLLGRKAPSKTHVIHKANLSFHLAEEYISFLLEKKHLEVSIDVHGVQRYQITAKGQRLLSFLSEIEKELEGLFPIAPKLAGDPISRPTLQELISNMGGNIGISPNAYQAPL